MSANNEEPRKNKESSWLAKAATVASATAITVGAAALSFGDDIIEVIEIASKNKKNAVATIIGVSAVVGVVAITLELLLNPDTPKKRVQVLDHSKLQDLKRDIDTRQ